MNATLHTLLLLPLLFSMTDQRGMNVEIRKLSDSTRIEVWHRNDTIFKQRTFIYKPKP